MTERLVPRVYFPADSLGDHVLVAFDCTDANHLAAGAICTRPVVRCEGVADWPCGLPNGHIGQHVLPSEVDEADPRLDLRCPGPAQDGEERLRALIAAVEGTAKECLGYADTSFIGNVPMGVKHVANRILGVLEKGPPKPEGCFTKACRAVVTYHHASCPLAALETRPREESDDRRR